MTNEWRPRQWMCQVRAMLNNWRFGSPYKNNLGTLASQASRYVEGKKVSASNISSFKTGSDKVLRDDSIEAIAHVLGYKLELIPEHEDLSKLRDELTQLRAFEKRVKLLLDDLKLPAEIARIRAFEKRVKHLRVDLKTVETKIR